MNDTVVLNKINQFFNDDIINRSANIAIFKNPDGSYEFFNKFIIKQENNKVKIYKKTTHDVRTFLSLKFAVAWCVFEEKNKIIEMRKIEDLDRKLGSVDAEIKLHKYLIQNTKNNESKLIYNAKLSNEIAIRKELMHEASNIIKLSTQYQSDRFNKKPVFSILR